MFHEELKRNYLKHYQKKILREKQEAEEIFKSLGPLIYEDEEKLNDMILEIESELVQRAKLGITEFFFYARHMGTRFHEKTHWVEVCSRTFCHTLPRVDSTCPKSQAFKKWYRLHFEAICLEFLKRHPEFERLIIYNCDHISIKF